jgi:RNA polymerase sigma-70 factor (ECF subfamily)
MISQGAPLTVEYTAIVQREWAFVRNAARRYGVPERHRDDVAIEVFLRFQKHAGAITAPTALRAWLRTATLYVAYEYFDARASRHETLTPTELIKLEGMVAGAEEGFIKKENLQVLLAHVDELEPKRRAVFRAYAIDGLTVAQIARRFGIPQATAYGRLRLARRDLQASLKRERLVEERKLRVRGLMFLPILLLLHPDSLRRISELLSKIVQTLPKGP